MRKSKYTEEQIIRALQEVEAGAKVQDVIRKMGVTETTFYRWKSKYGGLDVSEAKRLKALEDENRRLKQMVADQALDIQALKLVVTKKF
jgi:putative transposase